MEVRQKRIMSLYITRKKILAIFDCYAVTSLDSSKHKDIPVHYLRIDDPDNMNARSPGNLGARNAISNDQLRPIRLPG